MNGLTDLGAVIACDHAEAAASRPLVSPRRIPANTRLPTRKGLASLFGLGDLDRLPDLPGSFPFDSPADPRPASPPAQAATGAAE